MLTKSTQGFEISPGYSPTGFFANTNNPSPNRDTIAIPGTGGRILAVWYVTFSPCEARSLKNWF